MLPATHFCLLLLAPFALPASAAGQLVVRGADWSYLDDGSDLGSAWISPFFDDSAWAVGPAQFGYGDGDEASVISFGPDPDNKHITTYFRHEFQLANAAAVQDLTLRVQRDDGVVVYLNGFEVWRDNMPTGLVDFLTPAAARIRGNSEDAFLEIALSPALLVNGSNVIAAEVHLFAGLSPDLSFNLELDDRTPAELVRGPYLQMVSQTTARLRWRSWTPQDSRVAFGSAPGQLGNQIDDPALVTDHEVELSGLLPDSVYYYSVGSSSAVLAGDDSSHLFRTAALPGSTDPLRFWVLGDSGFAGPNQRAVRDAYSAWNTSETDLILLLGDNAYYDGREEEYQLAFFNGYRGYLRQVPTLSTRGNHEKMESVYLDAFSLPSGAELGGVASGSELYYSADVGNVHLICLDSESGDPNPGSAMMSWLDADLAATDADWIIAFWHHPPYSRGSHDSDLEPNSIPMRTQVVPVLEAGGVDLVLSGHSHSYERSMLLDGHYGLSITFDPLQHALDSGDGDPAGNGAYQKHNGAHAGAVYVVSGSAALTGGGTLDHPAMVHSAGQLGSVVIDVVDRSLVLSFLRETGVVQDTFQILTSDAPPLLEISGLFAGGTATVRVSDNPAGATIFVAYSTTGAGPTTTLVGDVDLSPPLHRLGPYLADAQGLVSFPVNVPATTSGMQVWVQAVRLLGGGNGILSNGLAEVIQ